MGKIKWFEKTINPNLTQSKTKINVSTFIPINQLMKTNPRLWVGLSRDDALKLSVSCRFQSALMGTCGIRTNGPNRRHRCGTDQEPFEDQVSE